MIGKEKRKLLFFPCLPLNCRGIITTKSECHALTRRPLLVAAR